MIIIRPRNTIYETDGGWFRARWHFSFDHYYDPDNMNWGVLRVFNDDILIPGAIWPMHPHRDIEGITYVAEGMFEHADSMGNGGVLPPGSVQRATLGRGMMHSERNHSKERPMRFIQMWIMPAERGLEPSVEQRSFSQEERRNVWKPVLVPAPGFGGRDAPKADGAVTVHQDASVYATILEPGHELTHRFRDKYGGYLMAVHGDGEILGGRDREGFIDERGAAKIGPIQEFTFRAGENGAELLLVEVRLVE
jgi:redox-sensitive bicupin YhaK (pirin superfamily)